MVAPMTTTMTLQEAADALGVHYMTVYRYVRLGRLPARKVGGTWEVARADVDAIHSDPAGDATPRPAADWSARLEARLVSGDEPGAWGVVEAALASGTTPADVHTELLAPALASVGSRWETGDLSVAQEHLATAVATRIIGRLGPRFARKGRAKGVVLVTTPPGERHAIPSLMVSDLLRGAGFEVVDLGADVPDDALADIIKDLDGLFAVCISSTRQDADQAIRLTVDAVHRGAPDVPVFAGGASITDADHAADLGVDGWRRDGRGATELIQNAVS
jgi:excisionase family DNA binding protein